MEKKIWKNVRSFWRGFRGKKGRRALCESKVGASYSVWDGEELLEAAIRSIRNEVDYVNVVWQQLSWYGNPCDPGLESFLVSLHDKGLIDEILFFTPDLSLSPNINETNKRNVGLEAAQENGCTHFLTLDADEFFDADEFRTAYQYVVRNGITHSACNQLIYHSSVLRDSRPADWFSPFIYQISGGEKFVCNAFGEQPWMLDPSKKIPIASDSNICFLGSVVLHHFPLVRSDVRRKIKNSSACQSERVAEDVFRRVEKLSCTASDGEKTGQTVRVQNQFGI